MPPLLPSTYALVRPVLACGDAVCHPASCQCNHSKLGRSCICIVVSYPSFAFRPPFYFYGIAMMQPQLLPREYRLTQTPPWQPSSTEVETKPASHTSHHHNLNHHPPQRQLPPTALLAASTSSIHDGHLPDAYEYRISAPSSLNRPNLRTLLRSVNQDSNWRSRASQRNGS